MDELTLIHTNDEFKLLINGAQISSDTKYTLTKDGQSDLRLGLELTLDMDKVHIENKQ